MYYVVELKHRAVIGDKTGTRVWDVCQERANHRAHALQANNPNMQFAVVPMCNSGNAALRTLPVEHNNPLKIRL